MLKKKTVTEAKKTLEDAGFTVKTYVKGDPNSILVSEQNPKTWFTIIQRFNCCTLWFR